MDPDKRRAAQELALLELLVAAQERRHEVMDVVWDSADADQAAQRLREMLGDSADPLIILDMPMRRLTTEARQYVAARVTDLRQIPGNE